MMMLRDVKVKTSSLLVGCAATLLVSLSGTVAADSVHSSDRRFGVGYKEETTSQFSSDQPSQVVLYRGEANTVRFTYTNQMYLMKDIRIALDGSDKSLTAQIVPGMGHVYEGFQTSARGIFTMSGVPESTVPVANPNVQTKYIRYFKVIDDMHNTMYKRTVFLVQPQAWKYTMKSVDQLPVDDLNHIGVAGIERMTTLIKNAGALLTTGGSGALPDNIKVSINPKGGQATITYGDGSTDIIPPAVLWKKGSVKEPTEADQSVGTPTPGIPGKFKRDQSLNEHEAMVNVEPLSHVVKDNIKVIDEKSTGRFEPFRPNEDEKEKPASDVKVRPAEVGSWLEPATALPSVEMSAEDRLKS
ncbi:TPA: hypothetical protein VJE62_000586 [Streptococcus pyogenes]|nr:hypothetical protein [Streptococcus pyogenes]